tara:strand:+ start:1145 stop:2503 length:1359 start_codon:yes stop_codon:yes gene_type:complete
MKRLGSRSLLGPTIDMHIEAKQRILVLDKILGWTALSSIFLSGLYVATKYGNLYFSYIVMAATYVLAAMRTGSFGVRKEYSFFFALLMGVSYLGYLVSSVNYGMGPSRFASITIKIVMLAFCILFFTSIYNLYKKSARRLFKNYLQVALFFAVLGVFQQLVFVFFGFDLLSLFSAGAKHYESYLGIAGLSVEPAFYACALLPAGAYYVSEFTSNFKLSLSGSVIVTAVVFSTSSLGYIGLFLSAAATIFFNMKLRSILVLVFTLPLLVFGAYKVSKLEFFQIRMNDTISVLTGAELTMADGINLSTYSLAVNMTMSMRSVLDNYGLGAGFGAYSAVFDHYIGEYEMPGYRDDLPGRGSATSLFARLTAEVGVVAWFFLLMICIWNWREIRRSNFPAISIAYSATLVIILLRMGEYYVNGVVLVFLMVHWIQLEGRRKRTKSNAPIYVTRSKR